MSLNTAHADHGVLIHSGESIILFSDNVEVEFEGNKEQAFKKKKNGRMYLTTHRMIYNSKSNSDALRSFSFPFISLREVTVEQPMFSANYIQGTVSAQPNGNFEGEVKFKLTFKAGGAIDFGQAMLQAASLASRFGGGAPPPPYNPPAGPWAPAAPPAYAPAPQGYYGWVPPYATFPDQPPPYSVFVDSNPPPYAGVTGAGAGYGPSPPAGYPTPNGASYPPAYPAYPAGGLSGGPTGAGGSRAPSAPAAPADPKAAEAAASAYYDPNRPQTAYVPPPYDLPPSYQETTSKKQN